MERLTQELKKNEFFITDKNRLMQNEDGYFGEVIDKLAKFENIYDYLIKNQEETIKEMEKLRIAGKTKSTTFKQLMVKKLTNNNMISLFQIYGI